MSDREPGETVSGACLCGAVRFEVTLPTLFCAHCHCTMCRRNHGAAFVTWCGVPPGRFRMVAGEDCLQRYASSEHGTRTFCSRCGSSLFCTNDEHPDVVDVVLANLDGGIDRPPQAHVYADSKVDWLDFSDSLPRLGGDSGMEPL